MKNAAPDQKDLNARYIDLKTQCMDLYFDLYRLSGYLAKIDRSKDRARVLHLTSVLKGLEARRRLLLDELEDLPESIIARNDTYRGTSTHPIGRYT